MKAYPETQQEGVIALENLDTHPFGIDIDHVNCFAVTGTLGIQVAEDGRVWVCLNGISLLRFKPGVSLKT